MERSAIRGVRIRGHRSRITLALDPSYQTLRCPSGKTPNMSVNPYAKKYSTLPKFGNLVCVVATRPKDKGRIAIVTNAGRAAVGAGWRRRERVHRAGNRE
jgi:hypothetical protein